MNTNVEEYLTSENDKSDQAERMILRRELNFSQREWNLALLRTIKTKEIKKKIIKEERKGLNYHQPLLMTAPK